MKVRDRVLNFKKEHEAWPTKRIAKHLGMDSSSVRRILKRAGCPSSIAWAGGGSQKPKRSRTQILEYARAGYTATSLGVLLGVTRQRASQLLHKAGVKPLGGPPPRWKGEGAYRRW